MVYQERHRLKKLAFLNSKIAKKLNISRNIVIEHLSMIPDEFASFIASLQDWTKKLGPYEGDILMWLKEYPDVTSIDWLQERLDVTASSWERCQKRCEGFKRDISLKKSWTHLWHSERTTDGKTDTNRFWRNFCISRVEIKKEALWRCVYLSTFKIQICRVIGLISSYSWLNQNAGKYVSIFRRNSWKNYVWLGLSIGTQQECRWGNPLLNIIKPETSRYICVAKMIRIQSGKLNT